MKNNVKITTIQIHAHDLRAIDAAAHSTGIGRSVIIRTILNDWIGGDTACGIASRISAAIERRAENKCSCKIPGGVREGGENEQNK